MYRDTYVEVNVNNLKHNIDCLVKCCPEYKYFFGVVKGNAYGHGYEIAKYLLDTKINYLAVSSLEEALEVRKYNKETPILCLEPIPIEYIDICIQNNVTITVHSIEYVQSLKKWLKENKIENNSILKLHIKVDSGMNRLGFKDIGQVATVYKDFVVNKVDGVLIEGIYTHFATTGFLDKEWDNQLENFKTITSRIDLTKIPIVHLDRSVTCITHPNIEFANGARFGLAMYGYTVTRKTKPHTIKGKLLELWHNRTKKKYNISAVNLEDIPILKPALSLKTKVIQIKKLKKGEFVGYGATYRANGDEYIATLPIGYADGLDLRNSGRTVYINSNPYKIVGNICMGMISVKVDEKVKVGDLVEMISENIDARCIARYTGQTTYSVITNISCELPRKYIEMDNNSTKQFEVVILGSDINTYFMARNFHEEYGIKSHIIAKCKMKFTLNSNICDIEYVPNLWDSKTFLTKLLEYGKKRYETIGDVPIILVGTNDTYVRLIIENADALKQYYVFNYTDLQVYDNISIKDNFYTKYEKCGIEFPKTYVFDCKENVENINIGIIEDFKFPLIIKAGNVVEYAQHKFDGQAKVYKIYSIDKAIETIEKIKAGGYTQNLIIQEYIPGDETHLFDAVFYSNTEGKVEFMTFAQIGLQERTITGIGNCTVLINGYNQFGKYKNMVYRLKKFIEEIGYRGCGEVDLKYDVRDGKYKVLEINPRQGRSSYYSTAVGYNLAKLLVDDLIYKKHKKFKMVDEQVVLSFVPMPVINKYINNKEYVKKLKQLKKEKGIINPLKYNKDMPIKRRIWLFERAINYIVKYRNNHW